MKLLAYIFVVLMFATGSLLVQAEPPQTIQTSPRLAALVERDGNQLRLVLTNASETGTFQGMASVSFDVSTEAAIRLPITLAPQETRRLSLPGPATSGSQYNLAVYNQAGTLVFYKIAPLESASGGKSETIAEKMAPSATTGIRVTARVPHKLSNREAELPSPEDMELSLLTVIIESPNPIKNASFTLNCSNFERRQPVTVQRQTELEFKLPVELSERRFNYTLSAEDGNLLARGKIDLDLLAGPDVVSVSELTFDRSVYTPGEAARTVIELQGEAPRGYRLDVTVREGETILFKDTRQGINNAGRSRQEFLFDLPREVKGPIILGFQVFGGQTGLLFDSGTREIVLHEAPPAKTGEGKHLAP